MNPQRPFDLGKLNFDAIRLRRRKRLLLYSAPLCLIALAISLKFIGIAAFSGFAHANYQHNQFNAAANWLQPLHVANWFESYKAPFNHGNILFKKGDFHEAEEMYRKALETVPTEHECSVRINLALTLERLGDAAVQEKKLDDAILHYDQVKAVLRDGRDSCGVTIEESQMKHRGGKKDADKQDKGQQSGDAQDESSQGESGSNSETARKIQSRVGDKSDKAKRARNNDSQDSQQTSEESSTDTKSTEDKVKELEERSNSAQQERAKSQRRQRGNANYEKNRKYRYDRKTW